MLGWLMGLEPTTTGITILCIRSMLVRAVARFAVTNACQLSTVACGFAEVGYRTTPQRLCCAARRDSKVFKE